MTLEQAISEAGARAPRRRRKVVAKQRELCFPAEPFRLVGEAVTADRAASLFSEMRRQICENQASETPALL